MIALGRWSSSRLQAVLARPGAFAWWYFDLLDEGDSGLVLIWFFGLPLLPGARMRLPALERPGLCLAIYRAGVPIFYALQEHAPGDAAMELEGAALSFRFGRSRITLDRAGDTTRVSAELDAPIPGSSGRLRGSIVAEGARARIEGAADGPHVWAPELAAVDGRARVTIDGRLHELAGRAYLDGNASEAPLDELGIASWHWGRLALPGRELVYYLLDGRGGPQALVVDVAPGGAAELRAPASVSTAGARRGRWGVAYGRELRLSAGGQAVAVRVRRVLDDGPFYLRFVVEAQTDRGERGRGIAETLVPSRVDRPWQRPLVRMRHHRLSAPNSLWLPLFNGPVEDRHRRLARAWWWRLGGAAEVEP